MDEGKRYIARSGDRFGEGFAKAVRALGKINIGPYLARALILDHGLRAVRKWTGQTRAALGRGDIAPEPKWLTYKWMKGKLQGMKTSHDPETDYEPGPLTKRILGMAWVERYSSNPTPMTLRTAVEIVARCDRGLLERMLDWIGGDVLWDETIEAIATLSEIKKRTTSALPRAESSARAREPARAETPAAASAGA